MVIGTSGWQYQDWRGAFYPKGFAQHRWLGRYADAFATVEINASFYRLPKVETFTGWHDRTPDDMLFAVKASRYLTHYRRLREPAEPVARLMASAAGLGTKLGCVLLQLPPDLHADPGALDATLACFPAGVRVAVEPRHPSWGDGAGNLGTQIRRVLEDRGAALCWADRLATPVTPLWRTADFGYLRLHEGTSRESGAWPWYRPQTLGAWADRICEAFAPDATVFVYTNNDPGGAALRDAALLAAELRSRGRGTTRVPSSEAYPAAPDALSLQDG